MKLRFTSQSSVDSDAEFSNTARLLNCYVESADGVEIIKSVLGTTDFADIDNVFLRRMIEMRGDIYAACGGTLYKVTSAGVISSLGSVTDGDTDLSSNNGVVCVAANGDFYTWNGTTLAQPTGYPTMDVGSVTFLGQYTIISEQDGRRIAWSDPADPTTWDALDFASAEGADDAILRVEAVNGQLVVFKETTREVWYITESTDSTLRFVQAAGGVIETGLKAFGLMVPVDNGAFFVGDDNVAYITNGISQKPVSNRAVETAIKQGAPTRCFYYEDEGHKIAVIKFTDRPAWCYDISTGQWHERENGDDLWSAVDSVRLGGEWYVGSDLGAISTLGRVNADGSDPLVRRATSGTLDFGDWRRIYAAEMDARVGIYDLEGSFDGNEPKCALQISKDRGKTWGADKIKGLGLVGDYDKRLIWRNLGAYRQITVRLSWSDANEVSFLNEVNARVA